MTPAESAARTQEILGLPPRLEPLAPDQLDAEAMAIIVRLRAMHDIPQDTPPHAIMTTLGRHPALFSAYFGIGLVLMAEGVLPARVRELAILRTGWLCRAPYEWGEHCLKAHDAGITAAEVEQVTQGSAAPGWTDADRAVLQAAEELHADAMIAEATWAALARQLDPPQLIELLMLIGHYTQTAYIQNALRFVPREGNPGLAGR
jgi:alkylhydroperoxidase family enzyme